MSYLDFKYDSSKKTYTISANSQFASAAAGTKSETVTVGDKQYTISVTKQAIPAATVTNNLTQTIAYNGTFADIVFSNVVEKPTRGNNALSFLSVTYDSNKKTYTVKANSANAPVGKSEETITVNGKQYTISLTRQAAPAVTYTGELTQTVAYDGSFETIVFKNVTSEPSRGNWSLSYLDFKYDSNAETYTISANSQFASAAAGTKSETITVGGKQYTISVTKEPAPAASSSSVASSSATKVSYTGNLEQTLTPGQQIGTIVFSNVSSKPSIGGNLWFLTFTYEESKKTFTISGGEQYQYYENGKAVNQEFEIDGQKFTLKLSMKQVSSSSVAPQIPSSSSVKSSSSVSSSNSQQSGSTPEIKIVPNGKSGSGYATRYWDSCKPHCAWSGKGGPATTPTRTCHADGSRAGVNEASACDGGTAGTCLSQIPKIVNDQLAYAFAASPGGENDCGRCFMLTFTGEGKDGTNARSRSLEGKKLIIISSNIGYDVAGGQFDIMIPGGGVGLYSGCQVMGLSCAGAQYGGLLADCESRGSDEAIKSCLIESCNSEYSNNAQAREGCLFMANWMNAASTNPKHNYVEVECPQDLLDRW